MLHKITGEFFRQRRLVSIVLSNRDNVVVAGFLADVCQLIKKNTRAHVQACTGSADSLDDFELSWLASTITDAVLEVLCQRRRPLSWQTATSPLLGFIRLGADAFLPQRV